MFGYAWRTGLDRVPPSRLRGAICIEIGAIAESVMTLVLGELGLDVVAGLAAAGIRGVGPNRPYTGGQVLAVEVEGTLCATARPRLDRGRLRQMSLEWLADRANPQMVEWDLADADVYGAVAHLNFARWTGDALCPRTMSHGYPYAPRPSFSTCRRSRTIATTSETARESRLSPGVPRPYVLRKSRSHPPLTS